jgi:hypothetical protein
MAKHARFMAAFCDDLLAGDYRAPRAKAVCEISHQLNREAGTAQKAPATNHGD